MKKDLDHIKEIDTYLAGGLSPEELAQFEIRLQEDLDFREEVSTAKKIIEGVQGYSFKKMLKDLHQKHFRDDKESSQE
ncbi:MAG TPA: hypothetical protein VK666_30295 [Chryseolinea sp.]|nr:hypothetical protein [Chryseolinea sp.]